MTIKFTPHEIAEMEMNPYALAALGNFHRSEAVKAEAMDMEGPAAVHQNRADEIDEVREAVLKEWEE